VVYFFGQPCISHHIAETVRASAKVTIECKNEVVRCLSNGVISNDLE